MSEVINIPFTDLMVHPKNIRTDYGSLKELTASIDAKGIQNPLLVVPSPDEGGKFWVVAGNRRLLAGKKSKRLVAPCIVSEMDEQEQVEAMLVENLHRKDLSIVEEASAYQMCLEDYGMDVKALSEKTGFSRRTIRRRLNVAKLDQETLREKMESSDMQLNFSILASLERVRDVETRNRILKAATDEKDLAVKVEQAVAEQERDKILKKIAALAKEAGIAGAPKDARENPYGEKYEIIKQIDPRYGAPDAVLTEWEAGHYKGDTLYYLAWYGKIKILKAVAREEPEEEGAAANEGQEAAIEEQEPKDEAPAEEANGDEKLEEEAATSDGEEPDAPVEDAVETAEEESRPTLPPPRRRRRRGEKGRPKTRG